MIKIFKKLFGENTLKKHLGKSKKVRIKGIRFELKKIEPMNHLDGSKVMINMFQTYEEKRKDSLTELNLKKVQSHMADIILAGVVNPIISRKKNDVDIFINDIFKDWELASEIYEEIMCLTYGKKKIQKLTKHI